MGDGRMQIEVLRVQTPIPGLEHARLTVRCVRLSTEIGSQM